MKSTFPNSGLLKSEDDERACVSQGWEDQECCRICEWGGNLIDFHQIWRTVSEGESLAQLGEERAGCESWQTSVVGP